MGRISDRRLYDPGVACGVVVAILSYWYRDVDAPIPLLAAVILAPYYAFIGFWWARKTKIETAALMGCVTALVGFEIVVLLTAIQAAATDAAPKSVLWLLAGLMFAPTVALVGAFCGLVGGALAHPNSIIQTMRRSHGHGASTPDGLAEWTSASNVDASLMVGSGPGAADVDVYEWSNLSRSPDASWAGHIRACH